MSERTIDRLTDVDARASPCLEPCSVWATTEAAVHFGTFAEALRGADSVDEAFALLESAVRVHGYDTVDYCTGVLDRVPPRNGLDWRIQLSLATDPARHEAAGTNRADFLEHDRSIPYAASRTSPWLLADLWARPPARRAQREAEARLRRLVRSGLSIPLHGARRRFAAALLGSDLAPEELKRLDRETRPTVFLLTAMFNDRVKTLIDSAARGSQMLTRRERECLLWAARGKTAWETGIILAVSESAVKKYLSSAARKLNALTRTQAVASAIARGFVDP